MARSAASPPATRASSPANSAAVVARLPPASAAPVMGRRDGGLAMFVPGRVPVSAGRSPIITNVDEGEKVGVAVADAVAVAVADEKTVGVGVSVGDWASACSFGLTSAASAIDTRSKAASALIASRADRLVSSASG